MLVSEFIAKFLKLQGADLFFTITGAGATRLIHSFNQNGLDYICPHHEQAAVMASISRMRLTGKPAICVFTGGPGAINSLTGIADAFLDSLPLIVIAGQESSHNLKNDISLRGLGVQGLRMTEITKTITKFSKTIMSAEEAPAIIHEAYSKAHLGRQGPVFIEIPMDVQWENIPKASAKKFLLKKSTFDSNASVEEASTMHNKIIKLIGIIQKSKRPLIWAGHGIRLSSSEKLFIKIIKALKIPVLTSWQIADIIDDNDPLYAGRAGTYGQRSANLALQNCDLLICMGTRLAIPQRGYKDNEFARAAKKVIIEIDKAEIKKVKFKFDLIFNNDIKIFLESFAAVIDDGGAIESKNNFVDWKSKIAHWKDLYPMTQPILSKSKQSYINSYNFISLLSEKLNKDHVIVTDMGTSLTCTHAALKIKKGQRLITSTGLGEMGYGLPAAIGCSLSVKKNNTILIAGEGSLMMNIQELQTLKHHKLPLKIFLLNNNSYLTIEHTLKALYGPISPEATRLNSGVSFPDFKKICKAFDMKYAECASYKSLPKKIEEALSHNGPILMNISMEPNQELIPKSAIKVKDDGSIYSPPLEDLYPFLDRAELEREMIIPLLAEQD